MGNPQTAGPGLWPESKSMKFKKSKKFIPFSPPWISAEDERAVLHTLRSSWITTGPKVKRFEDALVEYTGSAHAVATFSCTDAMSIALKVLGIKKGDEVITSPFTFASTAHVICYHGAKPVFVDVEPDTFNIDPDKIPVKINERTKAILPVHFGGQPAEMDDILDIAVKGKLFVMEDAAHALGGVYRNKKIGSIGDITCFSFYATKNITTAEGGMAVTDNVEWARRMRILTMYGISDARKIWQNRYSKHGSIHHDIVELGYKCNMTDICAALGIQQLKRIDYFIRIRERFARIYDKAFGGHPAFSIPVIRPYVKSARHLYPLLLNLDYLDISRDDLVNKLKDNNVGASVLFRPLHLHSYYAKILKHKSGDFPVAESLFERVVCLPISPKLGEVSIRKTAETVLWLAERFKR